MNARGILTIAYQVLHQLSYPGEWGSYLGRGVGTLGYSLPPLPPFGTWLGWGDRYLCQMGGRYLGRGKVP